MKAIISPRTLVRAAAIALVSIPPLVAQSPPKPIYLPGSYDGGYLVFQNPDSSFRYWLDGRIQVDAAVYSGS